MHYSQIPEKPLYASISDKVEPAQRIFFFERSDGSTIYVGNDEAWNLYSRGNQVLGSQKPLYKLIGTGDGKIFHQHILEARELGKTDIQKAQQHIKDGVQKELEACRGNIIPPTNSDKIGPGAQYIR